MLQKLITFLLTIIILGYIVFEEIVWERFARPIFSYISSLKILKKLDEYLQTINSTIILIIFLILFATVEILGLVAASFFLQGKVVSGVLIYAGKLPISAFTFWAFQSTKQKLMEFRWFKKTYHFVMGIIDKITRSQIYKGIKRKTAPIQQYLRKKLFSDKESFTKKIQFIYRRLRAFLKKDIWCKHPATCHIFIDINPLIINNRAPLGIDLINVHSPCLTSITNKR